MNQYNLIVRRGMAACKTCLNKQTCCSSVLASTSPDIRTNETQQKPKENKRQKTGHFIRPLRAVRRSLSSCLCCCRCLDENPSSSSRETGRGLHTHCELHRRLRTGGEQRHSKHLLRFIYNIIVLIWQPFSVEQSRQSFFDWFYSDAINFITEVFVVSLLQILSMHHNHRLTSYFIIYMIYAIHFEFRNNTV